MKIAIQINSIEEHDKLMQYCTNNAYRWSGTGEIPNETPSTYANNLPSMVYLYPDQKTITCGYLKHHDPTIEIIQFSNFIIPTKTKLEYIHLIWRSISDNLCIKFEQKNKVKILSEPTTKEDIDAFNKFVQTFTKQGIIKAYPDNDELAKLYIKDIEQKLDTSPKLKKLKEIYFLKK